MKVDCSPGLFFLQEQQVQELRGSIWGDLEGGQTFTSRLWICAQTGAGWTSADLVQGGRSCETSVQICPPLHSLLFAAELKDLE